MQPNLAAENAQLRAEVRELKSRVVLLVRRVPHRPGRLRCVHCQRAGLIFERRTLMEINTHSIDVHGVGVWRR